MQANPIKDASAKEIIARLVGEDIDAAIDLIDRSPYQRRQVFEIESLIANIKANGFVGRVWARRVGGGWLGFSG